jgi:hypothetical protein
MGVPPATVQRILRHSTRGRVHTQVAELLDRTVRKNDE